jgi:hypothetical protein
MSEPPADDRPGDAAPKGAGTAPRRILKETPQTRRAAALRANLARRKDQARARKAQVGSTDRAATDE